MEIIVSVACGLALFWTCFFSMLVRNSFPGDGAGGADAPWLSLALRIAFFIGFGAMAFLSSRSEKGVPDKREITIAGVLVVLFALDTVVMSIVAHLGWTRPLAVDLFAWALMGTGLSSLFFLWLPHLSHMTDRAVAICLTLSACAGAVACLALNLMDPPGNTIFLAVCALASLGLHAALTEAFHVQGVKETEGEPADGGADGTRAIAPMRFRLRLRKRLRPQVRKAAKKMLAARRIRRRPLLPAKARARPSLPSSSPPA